MSFDASSSAFWKVPPDVGGLVVTFGGRGKVGNSLAVRTVEDAIVE
jgi:putative alpha-1,2-mannosidase